MSITRSDRPTSSTIKFDNEFITPDELAKKLGESPSQLLRELKDEKGLFEDSMTSESILAWDTIQRACERRGLAALDSWENDKKTSLSKQEKEVLGYCAKFHQEYSELIEKSLPDASKSKSELASYHRNISESIENILDRVKSKTRPKQKSTEIESIFGPQ